MTLCKTALLSLLVSMLSVSCQKKDIFEECFDTPRPSFLVRGEQEISGRPDYLNFQYHGKFVGCADKFEELCKLLGLSKSSRSKAETVNYIMHSPSDEADWWDAPGFSEQIKEHLKEPGTFYTREFIHDGEVQGDQMGTVARVYGGNIYITKIGILSDRWGGNRGT